MTVELDSYTIQDFVARYGVMRSNIYNRLNGLKQKGYPMEPEKQGSKTYYNADQTRLMDALDAHLKAGGTIADFRRSDLAPVPQDNRQPSYKTQDSPAVDTSLALALVMDAIAGKLQPNDPLENLRRLEEVCDRGWLLSTSQLAELLGRKSLPGKAFSRYGFTFTRVGRNGAEGAWRVGKGEG